MVTELTLGCVCINLRLSLGLMAAVRVTIWHKLDRTFVKPTATITELCWSHSSKHLGDLPSTGAHILLLFLITLSQQSLVIKTYNKS